MADADVSASLAARLRDLRLSAFAAPVTQKQLAEALGISVPLISSWESATSPQLPREDWLQSLARFYATPRSLSGRPHLVDVDELSAEEEDVRRELIDELVRLREGAAAPSAPRRQTGALGGRFYHYPDGRPIKIVHGTLPDYELFRRPPDVEDLQRAVARLRAALPAADEGLDQAAGDVKHYDDVRRALRALADAGSALRSDVDPEVKDSLAVVRQGTTAFESLGVQYANPWHPNYIGTLWNSDADAALEVFGHIRAENPGADVRLVAWNALTEDDLTDHLVILGLADAKTDGNLVSYLRNRLEIPVFADTPAGADPEYDGRYVVQLDDEGRPDKQGARRDVHAPRFLQDGRGRRVLREGQPQLEYDVALLGRFINPLNFTATVTICSGIFSRGTYGAVRALTDATLRGRNETYLADRFELQPKPHEGAGFWMLIHVPVFAGPTGALTVTPDLSRPFHRLRSSA